jgi:hypothetical protein
MPSWPFWMSKAEGRPIFSSAWAGHMAVATREGSLPMNGALWDIAWADSATHLMGARK